VFWILEIIPETDQIDLLIGYNSIIEADLFDNHTAMYLVLLFYKGI
jgi:hypothetical protein